MLNLSMRSQWSCFETEGINKRKLFLIWCISLTFSVNLYLYTFQGKGLGIIRGHILIPSRGFVGILFHPASSLQRLVTYAEPGPDGWAYTRDSGNELFGNWTAGWPGHPHSPLPAIATTPYALRLPHKADISSSVYLKNSQSLENYCELLYIL